MAENTSTTSRPGTNQSPVLARAVAEQRKLGILGLPVGSYIPFLESQTIRDAFEKPDRYPERRVVQGLTWDRKAIAEFDGLKTLHQEIEAARPETPREIVFATVDLSSKIANFVRARIATGDRRPGGQVSRIFRQRLKYWAGVDGFSFDDFYWMGALEHLTDGHPHVHMIISTPARAVGPSRALGKALWSMSTKRSRAVDVKSVYRARLSPRYPDLIIKNEMDLDTDIELGVPLTPQGPDDLGDRLSLFPRKDKAGAYFGYHRVNAGAACYLAKENARARGTYFVEKRVREAGWELYQSCQKRRRSS